MNPLKQWRSWVLVLLLVGPVLVYIGLGMLWLWERGWVVLSVATVLWVVAGVAFSVLAARWTKPHPSCRRSTGTRPRPSPARSRCLEARAGRGRSRGEAVLEVLLEADATSTRAGGSSAPGRPLSSLGDQPARRRAAGRAPDRLRAGRRRPGGALPSGPRRRFDHPLALAEGRPGRRLHLQGQRPLFLPPAVPEPGRRARPAGAPGNGS